MYFLLIISCFLLLNSTAAIHLNRDVLFQQFNYSNETTFVNLSGMDILSVDEFTFQNLTNIERIRLSRNSIEIIHPLTFNGLFESTDKVT